jgi:hypothetical protein
MSSRLALRKIPLSTCLLIYFLPAALILAARFGVRVLKRARPKREKGHAGRRVLGADKFTRDSQTV